MNMQEVFEARVNKKLIDYDNTTWIIADTFSDEGGIARLFTVTLDREVKYADVPFAELKLAKGVANYA